MLRNIVLGIIVVVLAIGVFFFIDRPAFTDSGVPTYELEFNSKEWKDGSGRIRGAMVKSLIESDTLMGLKEMGVHNLLGEPDRVFKSGYTYKVDLGHSMSPAGDPWWYDFVIRFDSMGIAEDTYLAD